ncbi:MAG: M67 family metallopeptidase [Chloroflexi bacterium]|nr:M67 family metallopeptidase [Chloroflexota bacterium]
MVRVLRSVYDAMIAHVLQTPTLESCGLLGGHGDTVTRLFPTPNVADDKAVRYEAHPLEVRRILEEIDEAGLEHLGIYHSHPNSVAYPSATDRRLAAYEVRYIVISLRSPRHPEARAFQIHKAHPGDVSAEVVEESIEVVEHPI